MEVHKEKSSLWEVEREGTHVQQEGRNMDAGYKQLPSPVASHVAAIVE